MIGNIDKNTSCEEKLLLLGCGILKKEVQWLIKKNAWQLDTSLMASALHCDFNKLEKGLAGSLAKHQQQSTIVFYGCCHPRMDKILETGHSIRTRGQNCVDILLGKDLFTKELLAGAFFLFEDWALHWDRISKATFGSHPQIMQDIFQEDRDYILAIRTPLSDDFTMKAEDVARQVGLPLKWMDVELDHLEQIMQDVISRKLMDKA
jgi:hypothetical protein